MCSSRFLKGALNRSGVTAIKREQEVSHKHFDNFSAEQHITNALVQRYPHCQNPRKLHFLIISNNIVYSSDCTEVVAKKGTKNVNYM